MILRCCKREVTSKYFLLFQRERHHSFFCLIYYVYTHLQSYNFPLNGHIILLLIACFFTKRKKNSIPITGAKDERQELAPAYIGLSQRFAFSLA